MIVCENVSKKYVVGNHDIWALRNASVQVRKGEFLAIMGRSGSGKSTLLQIMGTLLKPTEGTVLLDGQNILNLKMDQIQKLRRTKIGFVFQQYRLLPDYTCWENICMPLLFDRSDVDKDYIYNLADKFGIADKMQMYPDQISGGEQQRVAILRAMAAKPSIILADEPTGNLDYQRGMDIMHSLTTCRRECGQTIVMVTHDAESAAYADRVIALKDGQIV